jgi:hypothetical protein
VKLTRHEIVLLVAVAAALVIGGLVKHFREVHRVPLPVAKPFSKK